MPAFLNLIGRFSLFDIDELDILALCNILAVQSIIIRQLFKKIHHWEKKKKKHNKDLNGRYDHA